MPHTEVHFFQERRGDVPVRNWLREVARTNARAALRCVEALGRLRQFGRDLRRPHADYLEQGIYELRVRTGNVNYRILYFFHGRDVALLANGFTKERKVPAGEIERAVARRLAYEADPDRHRHEQEPPDA